mgnify:CR=1 FL=1
MSRAGRVASLLLAGLVCATPAWAFDPSQTFREGTVVFSGEAGYGEQTNVDGFDEQTDLKFWNAGARVSIVPFGPTGSGFVYGALETGLGPLYQRYTDPVNAHFAGLAAAARYHFLSLGVFVPYVELVAAVGRTDLRVREIRSDFAFLLLGGVGASFFVTDETALYAGYRFEHVSNGNSSTPNRGFEAHTGVVGLSFYFPDW